MSQLVSTLPEVGDFVEVTDPSSIDCGKRGVVFVVDTTCKPTLVQIQLPTRAIGISLPFIEVIHSAPRRRS